MEEFVVILMMQLALYWGMSCIILFLVRRRDPSTRCRFARWAAFTSVILVLTLSIRFWQFGVVDSLGSRLRPIYLKGVVIAKPYSWPIGVVWLGVTCLLLIRLRHSYWRARRLQEGAEQWGPFVWLSRKIDIPIVAGIESPKVLLPMEAKDWPLEKLRAVVVHERAHWRAGDVKSAFLMDLACALFWMNPIVWVVASGFRRDAELAADDAVILNGVPANRYAELLLEFAGKANAGPGGAAVVAMVRKGCLEERILSILDAKRRRCARIDEDPMYLVVIFVGLQNVLNL